MTMTRSDQDTYARYMKRLGQAKPDDIETIAGEFFAFARRVGQSDQLTKQTA